MRITRHKRQVFLFLAAILVPAAVLVGLASRMLYQDRELAATHAVDQRRIAVDQLRRELGARLEAIRLQEIINASHRRDSTNAAVVFMATVEGDRLILPWEAPLPKESASFARHRQEGEIAEFAKKDDVGAAAAYRLALAPLQPVGIATPAYYWRALSPNPARARKPSGYIKLCWTLPRMPETNKESAIDFTPLSV